MKKQFEFLIMQFAVLLAGLLPYCAFAQNKPPFYEEIIAFKTQDSLSFPAPGQTLFIGSSAFTRWRDVAEYFPRKQILNRGFGGSSLTDLIRYQDDIIYPYQPDKIVIYCGENDFAGSDTITVPIVVGRFQTLFAAIRYRLPQVPIVFVSIKPSPGRTHLMPKFAEANAAIRLFLKARLRTHYVNVYSPMLNRDGRPKPDIFGKDSLHMNAKGYSIWQKKLRKKL